MSRTSREKASLLPGACSVCAHVELKHSHSHLRKRSVELSFFWADGETQQFVVVWLRSTNNASLPIREKQAEMPPLKLHLVVFLFLLSFISRLPSDEYFQRRSELHE